MSNLPQSSHHTYIPPPLLEFLLYLLFPFLYIFLFLLQLQTTIIGGHHTCTAEISLRLDPKPQSSSNYHYHHHHLHNNPTPISMSLHQVSSYLISKERESSFPYEELERHIKHPHTMQHQRKGGGRQKNSFLSILFSSSFCWDPWILTVSASTDSISLPSFSHLSLVHSFKSITPLPQQSVSNSTSFISILLSLSPPSFSLSYAPLPPSTTTFSNTIFAASPPSFHLPPISAPVLQSLFLVSRV